MSNGTKRVDIQIVLKVSSIEKAVALRNFTKYLDKVLPVLFPSGDVKVVDSRSRRRYVDNVRWV